jgi:hypothetical protein
LVSREGDRPRYAGGRLSPYLRIDFSLLAGVWPRVWLVVRSMKRPASERMCHIDMVDDRSVKIWQLAHTQVALEIQNANSLIWRMLITVIRFKMVAE